MTNEKQVSKIPPDDADDADDDPLPVDVGPSNRPPKQRETKKKRLLKYTS